MSTRAATGRPGGRPWPRVSRSAAAGGVMVILLAAAPLLGASVYQTVVLTSLLAYALLAMSINLVAGHAGLLTLAHAAYGGTGGYAVALASKHWTHNGVVQLLLAVVVGAGVAAVTGWIAVRASKAFFIMLSLAIGELLFILALQWRAVTRGMDGLSAGAPFEIVPGQPIVLAGYVYWIALGVFLFFAGMVLVVVRSPFGSALRGIRDNEPRMRSLGYPTSLYKYGAWVLSGGIAGAAGWIFVAQLPRFIAPAQLSFELAALMLLAVTMGGLGSMWGACAGAVIVALLTDVVSQDLAGHGPLILGLVFVAAVYVLPRGLAGLFQRRKKPGSAGAAAAPVDVSLQVDEAEPREGVAVGGAEGRYQ